jgi:hypothetical protein
VNARESGVGRVYVQGWNEPYNTGSGRRRPRDGATGARQAQATYAVHYSSWLCKYTCITCTAPYIKLCTVYRKCCIHMIHHVTYMQALGPNNFSSCSMACSGNVAEMCGGAMTNSLYRVQPCLNEYAYPAGECAQPVLVQLLHISRDRPCDLISQ